MKNFHKNQLWLWLMELVIVSLLPALDRTLQPLGASHHHDQLSVVDGRTPAIFEINRSVFGGDRSLRQPSQLPIRQILPSMIPFPHQAKNR